MFVSFELLPHLLMALTPYSLVEEWTQTPPAASSSKYYRTTKGVNTVGDHRLRHYSRIYRKFGQNISEFHK